MNERYGIRNKFEDISFEQYMDTILRFRDAIEEIRPNISSRVLLTTDEYDYFGPGSLTIITLETEAAMNRREEHPIGNLTEDLWKSAFRREFYINDETVNEPYMFCISNEYRDPKKLLFYGQCLDDKSKEVFKRFKTVKRGLIRKLQTIDDGFPVTSLAMLSYAYNHLK